MLALLFTTSSSVTSLTLDRSEISTHGFMTIMQGIVENIKINSLSFDKCKKLRLNDQHDALMAILSRNMSLTELVLDTDHNSKSLLRDIKRELLINRKIVDNIFPALV